MNIDLLKQSDFYMSFEVTYTGLHKRLNWDILKIDTYFYSEFNTTNVIVSPVYDWNGSLEEELKIDVSMEEKYYEMINLLLKK